MYFIIDTKIYNMDYIGKCYCGKCKYTVKETPKEIARCYCENCKILHGGEYSEFSKYHQDEIDISECYHLKYLRSSNKAIRGFCGLCNKFLFMIYDSSENIWIYVNTLNIDKNNIETYDIYKQ